MGLLDRAYLTLDSGWIRTTITILGSHEPYPTVFVRVCDPCGFRRTPATVVALDRQYDSALNTHQILHGALQFILYWNDTAWMVPPPRCRHSVFPLAQNGYMPRSKSSYGPVSLILYISLALVAYVFPLACGTQFFHLSSIYTILTPSSNTTNETYIILACSFVFKLPSPACSSQPRISRDSSVVVTWIWGSQGKTRYVLVPTPYLHPYFDPFPSPPIVWVTKQIPLTLDTFLVRPTPTFTMPHPRQPPIPE